MKIVFLIFPGTHLLDLSGPAQVFYEANRMGNLGLDIEFVSSQKQVTSEQGLQIAGLKSPGEVDLRKDDFLIIPGIDFNSFIEGELDETIERLIPWLKEQYNKQVRMATICSGSLILARSGLLNNVRCTSHWKCLEYMSENFPAINVLENRLFVYDRNIYTSAGMTSGIDMSLSIIEDLFGPVLTSKIAREMVVHIRRDKDSEQETIYLDYRTHFNPAIHKVQDYIISHTSQNPTLEELARVANMSVRNLTRCFKEITGRTITEFKHDIKLDWGKSLLNNPRFTIEQVAEKCGYNNPRQFRRIWKERKGMGPSQYRKLKMKNV